MLEAMGPLSARPLKSLQQGVMLCDAAQPGWPVVWVSTQWLRLLKLPQDVPLGRKLWDVFMVPGRLQPWLPAKLPVQKRSFSWSTCSTVPSRTCREGMHYNVAA